MFARETAEAAGKVGLLGIQVEDDLTGPRFEGLGRVVALDGIPRLSSPLHGFAAHGLFEEQGCFHSMPGESLPPVTELFRHRFLHALRAAKLITAQKVTELLSWKHSGFQINGGEKTVAPGDAKGRQRPTE